MLLHHQYANQMYASSAFSSEQLARLVQAQKEIACHLSFYLCAKDDQQFYALGRERVIEYAKNLNENIISYLNGISGYEDVLADQVELVMKQIGEKEEAE